MFAQARSRLAAFAYAATPLAVAGDRKSCWQLGEQAEHATHRRMRALLAEYARDWQVVLNRLQRFILAHLGDLYAILVLDETAKLKKGTMTVGVARQQPAPPARSTLAQGADEALADRVHPRHPDSAAQDRGAGGLEDGVERGGEVRAAVAEQELDVREPLAEAEDQVAACCTVHSPVGLR